MKIDKACWNSAFFSQTVCKLVQSLRDCNCINCSCAAIQILFVFRLYKKFLQFQNPVFFLGVDKHPSLGHLTRRCPSKQLTEQGSTSTLSALLCWISLSVCIIPKLPSLSTMMFWRRRWCSSTALLSCCLAAWTVATAVSRPHPLLFPFVRSKQRKNKKKAPQQIENCNKEEELPSNNVAQERRRRRHGHVRPRLR